MKTNEYLIGDEAYKCGIQKKLLSPGTKNIDLIDGSKVFYLDLI